jgi:hypothetical protein
MESVISQVNSVSIEDHWARLDKALKEDLGQVNKQSDLFDALYALQGILLYYESVKRVGPDLLRNPIILSSVYLGEYLASQVPKEALDEFPREIAFAINEQMKTQFQKVRDKLRSKDPEQRDFLHSIKFEEKMVTTDDTHPGFKPDMREFVIFKLKKHNLVFSQPHLIQLLICILGDITGQEMDENTKAATFRYLPMVFKLLSYDNALTFVMDCMSYIFKLPFRPAMSINLANVPKNPNEQQAHWMLYEEQMRNSLLAAVGYFERANSDRVKDKKPPLGKMYIYGDFALFFPNIRQKLPLFVCWLSIHSKPLLMKIMDSAEEEAITRPEMVMKSITRIQTFNKDIISKIIYPTLPLDCHALFERISAYLELAKNNNGFGVVKDEKGREVNLSEGLYLRLSDFYENKEGTEEKKPLEPVCEIMLK